MSDGPWVRSDDEHDYCKLVHRLLLLNADREDGPLVESNFDPRLKKSLYLLDSFLRGMHNLYLAETNQKENTSTSEALEGIVDAWDVFCRNEDTDGSTIPNSNQTETNNHCNDDERIETNAARLGQYFASDENAKDVSLLIQFLAYWPLSDD